MNSLLAKGKIPPELQFIDASSRQSIPVSEAIAADSWGNSSAVVSFLFWKKDEDLRRYAAEQIHSLNLPAEDATVLRLMAEFDHGAAMDQATPLDLRGRRKYLSASKPSNIRVLLGLIQERFEKMTREPPLRESQLLGSRRRNSDDCFYVVNLKNNNTYDQNVYLRSSADSSNLLETLRGDVEARGWKDLLAP